MLLNDKRFAGALAVFVLAMVVTLAQVPSWWTNRNVIETNVAPRDFAPINQGQVKWMATQAAAEFDEKLALIGGAGSNITALVTGFSPTNNYRPVNLGQLKYVSAPFYERLWGLGLTNCYPPGSGFPYPWSNSTNTPRDFALANIGQTKYVFSFNTEVDSDGDGIPDIWEKSLGSNPYFNDANAVNTNAWAQGQTNAEIYQRMILLTIPNAWAVYTNATQVAVVADIRSYNRALTVKAAEFFLDNTNGVTFGTGTAMSAMDGAFNSTNEMAQALFTPSFPTGERHVAYIHAQDSANHWCPFVTAIINPNVDDILNKVQANYSAIRDAQFTLSFTEVKNNAVRLRDSVAVKMKGPYKMRKSYPNGLQTIQNENTAWWFMPGVGGGAIRTGLNGNPDPVANRDCDFFWDVPLWRTRATCSISRSEPLGKYSISLTPPANAGWLIQNASVDYVHGFVSQISEGIAGMLVTMEFLNPMEVRPGVWLFTGHRHTLRFDSGDQIVHESILSEIKVNQGLDDAIFTIPTE